MPGRAAKGSTKKATRGESKTPVEKKATRTGHSPRVNGLTTGKDHGPLNPPKSAGPVDKRYKGALRIMNRGGSEDKAYVLLQAAVDDGDASSKYALGTWYLHGFFVKKNTRTAIKLLREAADENVAFAAFDLAVCYERGEGVKRDFAQAARYYLRAFLFGDIQGAGAVERLLFWKKEALAGRKLSREFGRLLESMGK